MKTTSTFIKSNLLVVLLALLSNVTFAQRTITGKVTDYETGTGLIGAIVTVVGTTRGAVTDVDGNYSVDVPEGSTQIRFASIGYAEVVATLGAPNVLLGAPNVLLGAPNVLLGVPNVLNVELISSNFKNDVIIVGYGSLRQKDITSAVAVVNAENFNKGNVSNPVQLLQGKVAGLTVARTGSDPNGDFVVRLRGLSSISGNTAPLVVIDGVPGVSLNLVDPNDIASIDVLKDGSAAAIYGTRASAGVILVTTKKGGIGKPTAEYNAFVAFDQAARRINTLSEADFLRLNPTATDFSPGENVNTNWFDEITRTGQSQVHNLSLSGSAGKGTFHASFNYRSNNGILKKSGFDQYNASLHFNQELLNNRLLLNGNLLINSREADYGQTSAFRYSITNNPSAPVKTDAPRHVRFGGYSEENLFDYYNPVAIVEQNSNEGSINRVLGSLSASYHILPSLSIRTQVSQERTNDNYQQYYSKQSKWNSGADRNGIGIRGNNINLVNILESTLNYSKRFNTNVLLLQGGYSYQQFDNEGLRFEASNILTNALTNDDISSFLDVPRGLARVSSYRDQNKLIAFFGRARFNFNDIYNLEVGVRREGSTRFGINNQWGLFPFASASADLGKIVHVNGLNQLKLRVGYGVTGTQPNQSNLSRLNFNRGVSFFYNGFYVPSYAPQNNANPDLKWEETAEMNIGVDFALAGYKLTGSVDAYNRNSKDLILGFRVPVPPNLTDRTWQNVATINNRGIEVTMNFNNLIDGDRFKWTPSLVMATYRIKLTDYGISDTIVAGGLGGPGQGDSWYTLIYNGAKLGDLWGPVRSGVNPDGSLAYEDINGDGSTTQFDISTYTRDQRVIGNGVPKLELGFNNRFTLGRFDLNIFLRGIFGHSLVNEFRIFYENLNTSQTTWNKVDTKYFDERVTAQSRFDNTHVENASFLKIDNATLGYNFKLPAGSWFRSARVYASGQNLAVFTGYTGIDPEPQLADNANQFIPNPLVLGVERRTNYFLARTFSFGVNFGF